MRARKQLFVFSMCLLVITSVDNIGRLSQEGADSVGAAPAYPAPLSAEPTPPNAPPGGRVGTTTTEPGLNVTIPAHHRNRGARRRCAAARTDIRRLQVLDWRNIMAELWEHASMNWCRLFHSGTRWPVHALSLPRVLTDLSPALGGNVGVFWHATG
jgi:hypothetical protein